MYRPRRSIRILVIVIGIVVFLFLCHAAKEKDKRHGDIQQSCAIL